MSDLKCCGEGFNDCKGEVKKRSQNTQYQDPESNWVTSCEACFKEIEDRWAEQWNDYWSVLL